MSDVSNRQNNDGSIFGATGDVRIETDSLGEVAVPADAHWGAQTQRSLANFAIGTETMPAPLVKALGLQKQAAARANMELGVLDRKIGDAIIAASSEVIDGNQVEVLRINLQATGDRFEIGDLTRTDVAQSQ